MSESKTSIACGTDSLTFYTTTSLSAEQTECPFKENLYIKPRRKTGLQLIMDGLAETKINLDPRQHWYVETVNESTGQIILTYKYTTFTIPIAYAAKLFQNYQQTSDGTRLYQVGKQTRKEDYLETF